MTGIRSLAVAAVLFALVVPVLADDVEIEYGSLDDLKGVKTVFIDSGTNIEFRQNAIGVLKKELPELAVSAKREDAPVTLVATFQALHNGTHCELTVVAAGSKPNAVRLIAKYADDKTSRWTQNLSTALMKRFARDYRKVNEPSK